MTERVPGCNQRTNVQTCRCLRPLSLASLASAPKEGAKGGCAAGGARFGGGCVDGGRLRRRGCTDLPSGLGGLARPLALPMGELARRKP